MKMVIKILIFLLLLSFQVSACELNKPIVSLSGPITMLIEELDLLKDKNLIAISALHPISKETSAKVLSGGLFLSHKAINSFKDHLIFYDKSLELERSLKRVGAKNLITFSSLKLGSIETTRLTIKKLRAYLSNCSIRLKEIKVLMDAVEKKLLSTQISPTIFFLGEIRKKLPQLIIANDGFVLSLKKNNNFKTYQSKLAYVSWAQKELRKYQTYKVFGISETKKKGLIQEDIGALKKNLFYKGVLTPGISQVHFLNSFLSLKD